MNLRAKWIVALLLVATSVCLAQRWGGRRGGRYGSNDTGIAYTEGGVPVDTDRVRTAREIATHEDDEAPNWTNDRAFPADMFSFARIIYGQNLSPSREYSTSSGTWITDFPDSDLNLSFRLHQMTSMNVDPNARVLRLTDPALFNYPWIYMVEPGRLQFKDEEVSILHNYLLNGGFLVADDFWGAKQWYGFAEQMKRVFPDREFVDLQMDHPIFHSVFELKGPMNKLQVPNYRTGILSERTHVTWEDYHDDGEDCVDVHIRAILDDEGRIMVIALHNSDNGDGWERERSNDYYFHNFSEKIAFPLAINIIYYSMTH